MTAAFAIVIGLGVFTLYLFAPPKGILSNVLAFAMFTAERLCFTVGALYLFGYLR